jgi:hypothetical protein
MPREIQAGLPQGSFLSQKCYSVHVHDTPKYRVFISSSFVDALCNHATDCKEDYGLR